MQMMTAYTEEIDEIEDGIAEILGQIDLGALKKNSVGIVTCHFDFIHSGFIAEMQKRLPFELIGKTTMASTNQHGQGMYLLALTVLTSDELGFETGITEPLDPGSYREKIGAAYSATAQRLPGKPSLILTFFPNLKHMNAAMVHRSLDETCAGVPIWGGVATHTDATYDHCYIFHNGNHQKACLAMLLIHGPIAPEFIVVSMPLRNIQKNQGRITESDGCVLKEINGITAQKYLEGLGVTLMRTAPLITPLIVYYEGTPKPVALAIYAVNDDGSLSCGGEVPVGASVTIGEITVDSIMASAHEAMAKVLACGSRNGMLALSCVSRHIMLSNHDEELNLIAKKMKPESGEVMPYMASYTGGEICPIRDNAGLLRNYFHNFTFSACVF